MAGSPLKRARKQGVRLADGSIVAFPTYGARCRSSARLAALEACPLCPHCAGAVMNVICASDPRFFVHTATMLLSLVSNNSHESVRIFMLCDGKLPGKHQISAMLRGYQADILFISVEEHFPQNLLVKNGREQSYVCTSVDRPISAA
jgi:hypothetical protein